jgi:acetolactate synthase-1/3 small subunit
MLVASARGSLQALNRIVSLLRGRDFQIESLTATRSETSDVIRIAIGVDASRTRAGRVAACLDKLEEVWSVRQFQPSELVRRELALIKVVAAAVGAEPVVSLMARGTMRVIELNDHTAILEGTGPPEDVDEVIRSLPPASIVEVARLGPLMMSRGPQPTTVTSANASA